MSVSLCTTPGNRTEFYANVRTRPLHDLILYITTSFATIRELLPLDTLLKIRKKSNRPEKAEALDRSTLLERSVIIIRTYNDEPAMFETGRPINPEIQEVLEKFKTLKKRSLPGIGLQLLGNGGQTLYYRAVRLDTGQEVAFGISKISRRFDCIISNACRSPYVAITTGTATQSREEKDPVHFTFGPLAEGTFDQLFNKKERNMRDPEILRMIGHIAMGILAFHEANYFHLDIHTDNVLYCSGVAQLTDFDRARERIEDLKESIVENQYKDWHDYYIEFLLGLPREDCRREDLRNLFSKKTIVSSSDRSFVAKLFQILPEISVAGK